jgi:hypothetical protein
MSCGAREPGSQLRHAGQSPIKDPKSGEPNRTNEHTNLEPAYGTTDCDH